MAVLSFNIKGLDATLKGVDNKLKQVEQELQDELNAWASICSTEAKVRASKNIDRGQLAGSINPKFGKLEASVTVAVFYAAYVEFGTKKKAAAYVASLPADWKTYAAQFKGKGGGDYYDFLNSILDWVISKGIANRYSVKTQRKINIKLGSGSSDEQRLEQTAYAIALSIIRHGVKPHPYLFPAYEHTVNDLKKNLKALFK